MFNLFINRVTKQYFDDNDILGTSELGVQDILDELNKDDDKDETKSDKDSDKSEKETTKETDEDEKPSDKDEKETDKEPDELDELEAELNELDEEVDEDKLELTVPISRREVLKKYPNIFKEFPGLERAVYREREYTELYPTIAEAREAQSKAETLDNYEADLNAGNIEKVLQAIQQGNPNSFAKVADNYLDVLKNVDEKAYNHVLGNVISYTVYAMAMRARESNNNELHAAARQLNEFMFGSSKWVEPKQLSKPDSEIKNPEKDQVENERREFLRERFTIANQDLNTRVTNAFKSVIDQAIDPKKQMTDYVRKNAMREAMEYLNDAITKDTRFKSIVDRLWEKAAQNKFNQKSMDDLRRAFLGRGKSLLPAAINKARKEALKGVMRRAKDNDADEVENTDAKPRQTNKSDQNRSTNNRSSKDPKPGESTLDYLMRD